MFVNVLWQEHLGGLEPRNATEITPNNRFHVKDLSEAEHLRTVLEQGQERERQRQTGRENRRLS